MTTNYIQSKGQISKSSRNLIHSNKTEHLYTNHFICSFADDITLYQYNVVIEELGSKSDDWFEVKGRLRCSLIMQLFIHDHQFNKNEFVWYDEQKCLYSTSVLSTPQTKISENGLNRLQIKSLPHPCPWSTNNIKNYKNGQINTYPYDAIRILETLLKRSIQDRVKIVSNKCYFFDEPSDKLNNGFEKRHGFIQALNLSANYLTLNIQTKLTTFYSAISLLDFVHKQIGGERIPLNNEYKNLNRVLRNCLIVTKQSNWKEVYEFERFDHRRPGEINTDSGDSLIEYYQKKGIILNQTNYPCIEVYRQKNSDKPCHLPLELCRIKEWQIYDDPMPEVRTDDKLIPTPEQRYYAIINTIDKCYYKSASNLLCRAVGFTIDRKEMLELDARILTQPQILSAHNHLARIDNGRIYLNGFLFEPKPISKLAITYFGTDYEQQKGLTDKFSNTLLNKMKSFNINVQHVEFTENSIDNDIEKIDKYFYSIKEQNYSFIVCIMNARNQDDLTQLKVKIKTSGTLTYGIMTQCALVSEIPNNEKQLENYCENLVRKVNFKNGGINTKVDLNITVKNKQLKNNSFMFFGADVIHPTNVTRKHPSIAAIVGSSDSSCSRTAVRVCKQYPKQGKCSIETIHGMTEMIKQLLDYYRQVNRFLPSKIVFYRDGVDDGQFKTIHNYEIPAIRQAFNDIYGHPKEHPSLTFIVVKKRHNTRFFTYNQNPVQQNNRNSSRSKKIPKETDNMSIGAVIDTTIVQPNENNFYLNSHTAYQGVNRPPHYHVLLNGIGFTTNELQLLTFHLCFTDPRSSAAEAIPSVVHQADLAAFNARDLFYNDDDSSTTVDGRRHWSFQNPSPNDLDYEILQVHENLQNLPVLG
ncbi:unnamed protein product [Rotaria sp. Silwood2]|nr:unnamed protein product [Rotaria sp. Silwood2]CAF4111710.1 unnamed protein product [Rotaria sp. Silwood2]